MRAGIIRSEKARKGEGQLLWSRVDQMRVFEFISTTPRQLLGLQRAKGEDVVCCGEVLELRWGGGWD